MQATRIRTAICSMLHSTVQYSTASKQKSRVRQEESEREERELVSERRKKPRQGRRREGKRRQGITTSTCTCTSESHFAFTRARPTSPTKPTNRLAPSLSSSRDSTRLSSLFQSRQLPSSRSTFTAKSTVSCCTSFAQDVLLDLLHLLPYLAGQLLVFLLYHHRLSSP